jgi:hypothetical protein
MGIAGMASGYLIRFTSAGVRICDRYLRPFVVFCQSEGMVKA